MEEILQTAKNLLSRGKPADALELLKKILREKNFADEWKIHELIGAAYHDLADARGAAQAYFNAAMTDTILRSQRTHFSNYIFALHYLPTADAKILSDAAQIYSTLYRDQEKLYPLSTTNHKLNVAFIAPHFLDSSSARFYEKLLTDFDRDKFFVTAWSLSSCEDDFTQKIRRAVDEFHDVSEVSFGEVAEQIQAAGTDILFDLGGHTEGGATLQIAAWKPARVQISGIGYFDTTGSDCFDYFLTDEFLIADSKKYFCEEILELPSAFAFCPNEKILAAKNSQLATKKFQLTFGCLNNFMKITDEYLTCVSEILASVENSEIIFRDTTPLESRREALAERIAGKNIPAERVKIFCGADDFFSDYAQIDLILDTFPYTGGFMTALALYMGVPVLNLCGEIHHTRLGAEMLRLAGLEELIVTDVDGYVQKAVELSRGENVKTVAKKIRLDQLTDTKSFVENFYGSLEKL